MIVELYYKGIEEKEQLISSMEQESIRLYIEGPRSRRSEEGQRGQEGQKAVDYSRQETSSIE